MIIYWIMLFWVSFWGLLADHYTDTVTINGKKEQKVTYFLAILTFSYIIFFIGLRSGIADTPAYISSFKKLPDDIFTMVLTENDKDKGFSYFSVFIKQFISRDYHVWLFILASISGLSVALTFRKYSICFGLSAYLFVTSCCFTWMLNGMRQFLAVTVIFACTGFIVHKKTYWYMAMVLLMSTIHATALIMIPIYFVVQGEPWNKKTILVILGVLFAIFFTDSFTDILTNLLKYTPYEGALEGYGNDDGANIMRTFIAFVPLGIAWFKREKIKKIALPIIRISINMAIINVGLFAIANVTSGILNGRLPIYVELYNLILLPWLIIKVFDEKERNLIFCLCVIFYLLFFYYQLEIGFGGLGYMSDILNINIW